MLSFSLKKTNVERLLGPAQASLEPVYGRQVWATVKPFIQSFEEARIQMAESTNARTVDDSVLNSSSRYYAFLKTIETSVPVKTFKTEFTWTDSLSKKTMKEASFALETTCVMFNLGAAYSKLGCNCDVSTQPGLKSALGNFLHGAGCFEQAKLTAGELAATKTVDLTNEYLTLASNVLMAQSYFCMYEYVDKATYSRPKLSMLAASISRHFGNAYELASRPPLNSSLGPDYIALLKFQQVLYKSASRYWFTFVDREEAEKKGSGFGKVVGRLRSADESLQAAYKIAGLRPGMTGHAQHIQEMIAAELKSAMRELTTIYVEPIVPGEQLTDPEEIANLKPKYPPPILTSDAPLPGQEVLQALVPQEVLDLQREYKEKLLERFNGETQQIGTVLGRAHAQLSDLNLPHKLDVLKSTTNQITEGLWLKVQDVQSHGGVAGLQEKLGAIDLSAQKIDQMFSGIEKMLQEEIEEDGKMRKSHGDRWTRPTSEDASRTYTEGLYRLKDKSIQAAKTNQELRTRLTQKQAQLSLLGKSKSELDALTPSSLAGVIDAGSPIVERLNSGLVKLTSIEKEIATVTSEWHRELDQENINEELIEMHRNKSPKDQVFARHLQVYDRRAEQLEELGRSVQVTMTEIETANQEFEQATSARGRTDPKLEFLKGVEEAVTVFNETAKGVDQGAAFYRSLEQKVVETGSKISNYVFARNSEKQELIVKISSSPAVAYPSQSKPLPGNPGVPVYGGGQTYQPAQGYPSAPVHPSQSYPTGYQQAYPTQQYPGGYPQPQQGYGYPPQAYPTAPYGGVPGYQAPGGYPPPQNYPYAPYQGQPQGGYPPQQRK